jgi:hypothetical protein
MKGKKKLILFAWREKNLFGMGGFKKKKQNSRGQMVGG